MGIGRVSDRGDYGIEVSYCNFHLIYLSKMRLFNPIGRLFKRLFPLGYKNYLSPVMIA